LAEYLGPESSGREFSVAYEEKPAQTGSGILAEKLKKALQKG
jgi:hypothetical protein